MTYIKGSPDHWTEDMTDVITVYKKTTLNAYGKLATSTTGTTYSCRIMADTLKQNTEQNRSVFTEGRLVILGNPDIGIGDRIVLDDGSEPIVTKLDKKNYSANGVTTPHHAIVFFGRA